MKEKQSCKHYTIRNPEWDSSQIIPDEATAMKLAGECLVTVICDQCDLCLLFCPDLCITRNAVTRQIEIDLDYCKGCGICAFICPKNAIEMKRD